MRAKRKLSRAFTLLEIMICIMILTVAASICGYKIVGIIDIHQFQGSSERLKSHLLELQILAMSHKTDIYLTIEKKDGVYTFASQCDAPLKIAAFSQKETLGGIKKINFNKGKAISQMVFNIYSSGRIAPAGVLRLEGEGEKRWIDLSCPLQIKLCKKYPKAQVITIPECPPCKSEAPSSNRAKEYPPNTVATEKILTPP